MEQLLKSWFAAEVREALSMEVGSSNPDHVFQGMSDVGLNVEEIYYNSPTGVLYEQALLYEQGSAIVKSRKKTGRSPLYKRIVFEESTADDVWWGKVNVKLEYKSFLADCERAVEYLNTRKRLYIVDRYGGWEEEFRVPVRVVTPRAYHALFMQNMLVPPTDVELDNFMGTGKNKPFMIYNAGVFPCNRRRG